MNGTLRNLDYFAYIEDYEHTLCQFNFDSQLIFQNDRYNSTDPYIIDQWKQRKLFSIGRLKVMKTLINPRFKEVPYEVIMADFRSKRHFLVRNDPVLL